MRKRSFRRLIKGRKGQTVVEYLLTTVTLVTVFVGMYSYLQKGLTAAFTSAAMTILAPRF